MTSCFSQDLNWVFDGNFIAKTWTASSMRGLNIQCTEAVSGDRIGSLITMLDLKQITSTYKALNCSEERQKALIVVSEEQRKLDSRISTADVLIQLYKEACRDLRAYQKRKNDVYVSMTIEKNNRRLARLRNMHEHLSIFLQDHECGQIALDCRWEDESKFWVGCFYSCGLVANLLERFINAPSEVSVKKIKLKAAKIREYFDILLEKDFFSYAYLGTNDHFEFESVLQQYARDRLTHTKILSTLRFKGRTETFIEYIRKDKLSDAFYFALNNQDSVYQEVFAMTIDTTNLPGFEHEDFKKLARTIWKAETSEVSQKHRTIWEMPRSRSQVKAQWMRCNAKYQILKPAIIEYLTSELTALFLGHQDNNGFTRLDAVRTVFTRKECFELLQMRAFTSLRTRHRMYFNNPERHRLLFN